ncbi:hypothetical protein K443DRAFT_11707 [Laccaria amethystina LaAM-08-1]|uniref:Uncharacterized protein n=1 Tax=Laccaria amethystina LaAM-08-1 TaxID=1095629 RepID=A0A0C9XB66_9AGAR|nr:hypothetical protein K443DRAFT_11707 [Laccaria amethystina LaAM-08-1]
MDTILFVLSLLALILIPLSLGYFFNTSWIRPFLWIPAESTSLMGSFFLLKPTPSFFESSPYAIQIASIVLFSLIADIYFKILVFLGAGCPSEEGMAQTFVKFFMIHGRKFGVHFIDLVNRVLGLAQILLDCAGGLLHALCFGNESEDDIDLESQTRANTRPSYAVSVEILH